MHATPGSRTPLGRSGTPDEIGRAVLSLVTGSYPTRAILAVEVDGGLLQIP